MEKSIQIPYDEWFERKCRYAAAAGFETVTIQFTPLVGKDESEWACATENVLRILEENKLRCIQSHLPYYDLLESSEIPDETIDFALHQALKASGKLGIKYGALHPRSSISTAYLPSKGFEDNRKIIDGLLDDAVAANTVIAVENMPIFPDNNRLMPFYSSSFEDLATLVDSFDDEHVGICWDFGHANLLKWDQATAIEFLGNRIKCTHVHNNSGHCDDHATPDSGNIDWYRVMPALAKTGYDGPLTAETLCIYPDPELLRGYFQQNYVCLQFLERLMVK